MRSIRICDMSITRQAFLRLLPDAVGGQSFSGQGSSFWHTERDRAWRITLEPLPSLPLGAMNLERFRVEILCEGYSEAEIAGFLKRFDDHFMRAGG